MEKEAIEAIEAKGEKTKGLDPKYLKGFVYRDATMKEVERDGRKVREYVPRERAMKTTDILAWNESDEEIVMVSGDGQKMRVKK